jgi:3-oxoacid CoA-transferase subunit B
LNGAESFTTVAARETALSKAFPARERIARRAAKELSDRDVDFGIEIPALVARLMPPAAGMILRSDSGLLGIGPFSTADDLDAYLVQADRESVIHGGPIDLAIVGAIQVGEHGDLAASTIVDTAVKPAAMDLLARAKRVVVVMEHTAADGTAKILRQCSLPLAGQAVVRRIVTELAVIDVTAEGLVLREVAPGISAREVQEVTEPTLKVPPDLSTMVV